MSVTSTPPKPRTRLRAEDIIAIRAQYRDNPRMTYRDIALEHHLSILNVHLLITGKTWKHLPGASVNNRERNRRRGAARPHAKLTVAEVSWMVTRYDTNLTLTYNDFAQEYHVSRQVIANVFRHLDDWLPTVQRQRAKRIARGARRGEDHPFVKLNDVQVRELRELRVSDPEKWTLQALSAKTGMCPSGVSRLVRGLSRPEAGGPIMRKQGA